ncbi:SLBB domain-containing protein [Labilibacter marinus]|uniref:SLBB domain-containing protein n=1 Tax=Labilibacter marinus TaxID=1477105 RepID=UPI0009501BBA|nr:SLBB domain-containing protein [Labilibacter marinus]
MRLKVLFSFFIAFLLTAGNAVAQNVDPQNVDVNALSTSEVKKIVAEMNKRGMSEQEAIALARARGMTESEISALKKKIEEVKMGGGDTDLSAINEFDEIGTEESLSSKAIIDSAKIDNRIFGFQFFNNENLSFFPGANSAVSPSYLLGSGDGISIDVWGASQQSYQLTIDRNGKINIPNVGLISVGGLTLEKASSKIRNKLVLIYRDLDAATPRTFASISISEVKAIRVNVIGEVFAPGTYTLSGASTAFNALYLAGGPNQTGSFREIKVIRDGKLQTTLDVYDYLINGNSKVNISLRDGDVILVSPYINKVVLEGEVKRTGVFEGKKGETVQDILSYAGGFTDEAYTERLELYRKTGKDLLFKDATKENFDQLSIQNGDSLVVGKITQRFQNMVSLEGAVYRPGDYELQEGLNLSTLIKNADGIRGDASIYRGIITRVQDDYSLQSISFNIEEVLQGKSDLLLQKEDIVNISSIHDLREYRTVQIYGEVQSPGVFDFKKEMTVEDIIYEAGGFLESASDAYIEVSRRLSVVEGSTVSEKLAHVYKMKVPRSLELTKGEDSFELQPFDQIFVRKLPGFSESAVVRVRGEIAYAGEYALKSKVERLSDLIARTGGLTTDAYPEGAMLTRKVEISEKQKRLRAELLERDSTLSFTDLNFDVVGVSLKEALENPGGRDDVFLKGGDEIFIPREMQTVKVSGEVLNPISSTFIKSKKLKSYIWDGGGFGLNAKKGKVYVVYPNGSASGTKSSLIFFKKYPKVTPGAEIVVPQKPQRAPMTAAAWIGIGSALASLSLTVVTVVNQTK